MSVFHFVWYLHISQVIQSLPQFVPMCSSRILFLLVLNSHLEQQRNLLEWTSSICLRRFFFVEKSLTPPAICNAMLWPPCSCFFPYQVESVTTTTTTTTTTTLSSWWNTLSCESVISAALCWGKRKMFDTSLFHGLTVSKSSKYDILMQ